MSYMPSGTPLPSNSQSPNTARLFRNRAREQRVALLMARGRGSNLQQYPGRPTSCGGATGSPGSFTLATMQAMNVAGVRPPAVASTVAATAPNGSSGNNGASGYTASEQQFIADAPEMLTPDTAQISCGAASQDPEPSGAATTTPPWANARVRQTQAPPTFAFSDWLCSHPWLALGIAVAGGAALFSGEGK